MGFLFVGSVGITPQWFTSRRSLANAIAAAGSGIGGLTYSLATNKMLATLGLGWSFRILGLVSCGVNTSCALIIRDRNRQVGGRHAAFSGTLLRRLDYLCLLGWGFFSMLGYVVVLFSLPNYAASIGLTAAQGSIVGAVLNLGQGLGRPPIGYVDLSSSSGRYSKLSSTDFSAIQSAASTWRQERRSSLASSYWRSGSQRRPTVSSYSTHSLVVES